MTFSLELGENKTMAENQPPQTMLLQQLAAGETKEQQQQQQLTCVDLGAGSGAQLLKGQPVTQMFQKNPDILD